MSQASFRAPTPQPRLCDTPSASSGLRPPPPPPGAPPTLSLPPPPPSDNPLVQADGRNPEVTRCDRLVEPWLPRPGLNYGPEPDDDQAVGEIVRQLAEVVQKIQWFPSVPAAASVDLLDLGPAGVEDTQETDIVMHRARLQRLSDDARSLEADLVYCRRYLAERIAKKLVVEERTRREAAAVAAKEQADAEALHHRMTAAAATAASVELGQKLECIAMEKQQHDAAAEEEGLQRALAEHDEKIRAAGETHQKTLHAVRSNEFKQNFIMEQNLYLRRQAEKVQRVAANLREIANEQVVAKLRREAEDLPLSAYLVLSRCLL